MERTGVQFGVSVANRDGRGGHRFDPPLAAAESGGGRRWLVVFAVYTNDRLADVDTDVMSNPGQAAFVRRHRDVLYVLASIAYGLAVALSVLGGPIALAVALLPGVFWVCYATNWIPGQGVGRVQRLKDVFLVNTIVVALAWAATLTFLPLAFAGEPITTPTLVVFSYFFLRVGTNTEIPNVRDVDGDRAIGVRTIPVVFGVTRTRWILSAIDLCTAGLVVLAVSLEFLSPTRARAPRRNRLLALRHVVDRPGRERATAGEGRRMRVPRGLRRSHLRRLALLTTAHFRSLSRRDDSPSTFNSEQRYLLRICVLYYYYFVGNITRNHCDRNGGGAPRLAGTT